MSVTPIKSLDDIALLRETVDLECKLAVGRDGQGAVPDDFWPTYSSFANTRGGTVVFGVSEKDGQFQAEGIANVTKVRRELFDALNNPQKVSVNLLTDEQVQEVIVDGRTLLIIDIPRATRKQRPVHLTTNPLHAYRRLNDGDRRLTNDEVKRLLAEQVEDSRDTRIVPGFDLGDLDQTTLRTYRQVFASREPDHPWVAFDDREFLRNIGGWRRDRETNVQGLTLAGLLMFGTAQGIQEVLPHYMLDYQERPADRTEQRWIDRLTLDGKWSGNLYDFYRRVYLKLTADLKVPFRLEHGERKDETPIHEALREALSNVLVHADYTDRASVLVVKRPDMFGFRNPGLMRIPVEVALHGGEHDCRNRLLHQMFRYIGVGEQAGTGIPKILQGWRSQHWHPPKLSDTMVPYAQTLLELRMLDLFPESVMLALRTRFGMSFEQLDHTERVALALAASEGTVTHGRLKEIATDHPVDLSRTLRHLIQGGFLESSGGRGAVYNIAGWLLPTPDDVFGPVIGNVGTSSQHLAGTSQHLAVAPQPGHPNHPPSASANLTEAEQSQERRDANGCLLSEYLNLPIIEDLAKLTPALRTELEAMAHEPRAKAKLERETIIAVILALCQRHFVTLRCLAALVNREPESLRNHYLTGLVKERRLALAFPTTPNHERQAYCAVTDTSE
jgi:predicted HTH transcriptional regulator